MSALGNIERRISEFAKRCETEREFCLELFNNETVAILAAKYSYYERDCEFWEDMRYDIREKTWYIMGRALGILAEDETSPCVGFDYNQPLAGEVIKLEKRLRRR